MTDALGISTPCGRFVSYHDPSQPCAPASSLDEMCVAASFQQCIVTPKEQHSKASLDMSYPPRHHHHSITSHMCRIYEAAMRSNGHVGKHWRFNLPKYEYCNSFWNAEQGRLPNAILGQLEKSDMIISMAMPILRLSAEPTFQSPGPLLLRGVFEKKKIV